MIHFVCKSCQDKETAEMAKVRVFKSNNKYRFLVTLLGHAPNTTETIARRALLEIPFVVDMNEAEVIATEELASIQGNKCYSHPWEVKEEEAPKSEDKPEVLAEDKKPDRYEYKTRVVGADDMGGRSFANLSSPGEEWRLAEASHLSINKIVYTWERKVT